MRRLVLSLCLSLAALVGVTVVALHPAAQESDQSPPPKVTESELQTFIKIYSAMQINHDLTIQQAIAPYNMSLDDFRQLERHIQKEQRLVDRVRQALLTQAQSRSAFDSGATSNATVSEPTPTSAPAVPRRKRKH
jgi:TolA-binding protein